MLRYRTLAKHRTKHQGAGADLASHGAKVRRSALWAAYGDALGWISELTDEAGLKRRTAGGPLCRPVQWKRRIGGRSGVTTLLPQGCYSDDSQLRLATSRAIRPRRFRRGGVRQGRASRMAELCAWRRQVHKCRGRASCQTQISVVCQHFQGMDQIGGKWCGDAHSAACLGRLVHRAMRRISFRT